jgi:predicted signal transduction protein with EAL and GGDEF domain
MVTRAKRHKDFRYAVLFIDIDRFKIVNDSLGHHAGDELIVQFSKRILHCLRLEDVISRPAASEVLGHEWTTKDDTLARLGGDEFTVLLDDLRSPTDSIRVASRIQQSLAEPFLVAGQEVFTTASIGIAASSETIHFGGGRAAGCGHCHVSRQGARARRGPKSSITPCTIKLWGGSSWKPICGGRSSAKSFASFTSRLFPLLSGQIAGFEALVRWDRPGVGIVSPAEFIGVAEDMGLIVLLGYWVLRMACEAGSPYGTWRIPGKPC